MSYNAVEHSVFVLSNVRRFIYLHVVVMLFLLLYIELGLNVLLVMEAFNLTSCTMTPVF